MCTIHFTRYHILNNWIFPKEAYQTEILTYSCLSAISNGTTAKHAVHLWHWETYCLLLAFDSYLQLVCHSEWAVIYTMNICADCVNFVTKTEQGHLVKLLCLVWCIFPDSVVTLPQLEN